MEEMEFLKIETEKKKETSRKNIRKKKQRIYQKLKWNLGKFIRIICLIILCSNSLLSRCIICIFTLIKKEKKKEKKRKKEKAAYCLYC